jgi:ATP-binding cassette subfamily B protein
MNIAYIKTAWSILKKLDHDNKKSVLLFIILSLISSILEFIAIGSLYPFILFLTDHDNKKLDIFFGVFHNLGLMNKTVIVSLLLVTANLSSGILKILVLKMSTSLSLAIGLNINKIIFSEFLYTDYEKFILKNKEHYIELFTTKIGTIINNFFFAIFSIFNGITVIFTISILLLLINPNATVISFLSLAFIYFVISKITSKSNLENGKVLNSNSKLIINILNNAIKNIRGIKIASTQEKYIKEILGIDRKIKISHAKLVMLSQSPKFIIESIGICIVGMLTIFVFDGKAKFIDFLPFLAVLTLSAQKMLPSFQLIYLYNTLANSTLISANELNQILISKKVTFENFEKINLIFEDKINLKNISFKYSNSSKVLFNNLNFTICKGDRVGVIGDSGSGKSTLIDLIIGLLYPTSGNIYVDEKALNNQNVNSWQDKISIVSQEGFITNASIAENIHLDSSGEINYEKIWECIRIVSLYDFINNLPDRIHHQLVDNGGTLSGGQKQRICLARALYRGGEILILDEATSALDKRTSKEIMELILKLPVSKTIIIVTHDIDLIKNCNIILNLNLLKESQIET